MVFNHMSNVVKLVWFQLNLQEKLENQNQRRRKKPFSVFNLFFISALKSCMGDNTDYTRPTEKCFIKKETRCAKDIGANHGDKNNNL